MKAARIPGARRKSDRPPLKLNQEVTIEVDTGEAQVKLPGKIIFLSPVVDPASGLLKVKVLFHNAEGRIRPGLSGRMIF